MADRNLADGVTRFPCPACGSMLTEEGICTNNACESRGENQ